MDKKYLISLIVIVALVILFIISVAFSPEEEVKEDVTEQTCEEKCNGAESCLSQCADIRVNLATLNNDASECEKIDNLEKRNECLRNVGLKTALNSEDEALCQDENCMNSVRLSKALSDKDPSLCEQITIEAMKSDCLELTR